MFELKLLVQPNFKFSLESVKFKVIDGFHFEFTWKIIPLNLFTFIQSSFQKGSRTGNNMAGDQGNESGSAGHCTLFSFHITSFVNIREKCLIKLNNLMWFLVAIKTHFVVINEYEKLIY